MKILVADLKPGMKVNCFGAEYFIRYLRYFGNETEVSLQPEPLSPLFENDVMKVSLNNQLTVEIEKEALDNSWLKNYQNGKLYIINDVYIQFFIVRNTPLWFVHSEGHLKGIKVCPEGTESPEDAYKSIMGNSL